MTETVGGRGRQLKASGYELIGAALVLVLEIPVRLPDVMQADQIGKPRRAYLRHSSKPG